MLSNNAKGFRRPDKSLRGSTGLPIPAAVRSITARWTPVERVALAATVATPVVLFLDYRLNTDFVAEMVMYVPMGENAGRPAAYGQIVGLTQALWAVAALGVFLLAGWRKFVANAQLVVLILALDVLVAATALYGGVDSTTALTVGATLLSYIAMIAVLRHPDMRPSSLRDLTTVACVGGALVVALTIAKNALEGQLSQRLGTFAFGPAPETALVLAPLLLLVAAMRGGSAVKLATAASLGTGLVLTQTRGALIATLLGALALLAMNGKARSRVLPVGVVIAAAGAYAVFSQRSPFTDQAVSYRWQNLEQHWGFFLERPLLGHGLSYESIGFVRAAHNTILAVANAGGVVLFALWVAAWVLLPLAAFLDRRRRLGTAFVGLAAVGAVIVGWSTTGSEVLLYDPPTNLLPLMLGVVLIGPNVRPRWLVRGSHQPQSGSRRGASALLLTTGVVVATIVATLSWTGSVRGSAPVRTMPAELRALAVVASEGMALSSCGDCRVTSIREVAPELVEARFSRRTANMPSQCIFISPRAYRPRPPGLLPPGVAWGQCAAERVGATVEPSEWLDGAAPRPETRVDAQEVASDWLRRRCTATCAIGSVDPVTPRVWKVRTTGALEPSRCFYLVTDQRSSVPNTQTSVSCALP